MGVIRGGEGTSLSNLAATVGGFVPKQRRALLPLDSGGVTPLKWQAVHRCNGGLHRRRCPRLDTRSLWHEQGGGAANYGQNLGHEQVPNKLRTQPVARTGSPANCDHLWHERGPNNLYERSLWHERAPQGTTKYDDRDSNRNRFSNRRTIESHSYIIAFENHIGPATPRLHTPNGASGRPAAHPGQVWLKVLQCHPHILPQQILLRRACEAALQEAVACSLLVFP